jgi:signal transduction histidine kinase
MHTFFKTNPPSPFITTVAYFSLNLVTGLLAALLLFLFPHMSPFLLFLPTILFVAWYSGFLPGFITTVISMSIIVLLLFFPTRDPLLVASTNLLVEIILFFVVGIFASYIIDKAKNQDLITDYQKRLRQNTHVIETLERNFENAQKEIKSRDQFLAIASHELKTPVTSMLLQVQTAIHNIRNVSLANFSVANLLKMLEGTEQQSQRLSKMVNDLLNVSLITTGRIDLELEETDLSTVVKNVAENFSEKMKRENNSISVTAEKPIRGTWDKVRIEQAVSNLISNAIKYGNNKPIAITVSNSHERAKLTVEDKGIGMSQEQQKRIFERFERAVNSKEYQGLGVGLYITSQIVKAHHGKIDVHSKPNDGTTFIIELPLRQK